MDRYKKEFVNLSTKGGVEGEDLVNSKSEDLDPDPLKDLEQPGHVYTGYFYKRVRIGVA